MKHLAFALLLIPFVIVSCGKELSSAPQSAQSASLAAMAPSLASKGNLIVDPTRKLIRNADLDITVKEIESASSKAQAIAASLGGYVASASTTGGKQAMHGDLVLRVPASQFESGVTEIKKLAARVNAETIKADDVTDKHVDLEARLKALNLTENEIQKLLEESKGRGHNIADIMALHKQLTELRGQSEQIQGQLNLLNNQVAYSTIHLLLRPEETLVEVVQRRWHPAETAQRSWHALLSTLQVFGDALIVIVVYLIPVGLILAVLITVGLRLKRWFDLQFDKGSPAKPPPTKP